MPKGSNVQTGAKKETSEKSLFLACFYFDEPGEQEHTGSFQIVVEAPDPDRAVDVCRTRLRKLRVTGELFDNPITIYLEGLVRLGGSFKGGVLVNYESGIAPPEPAPTITCLVPGKGEDGVESYHFAGEAEDTAASEDGSNISPFVDFGGFTFRKALEAAKNPSRPSHAFDSRAAAVGRASTEPEHPIAPRTKARSSSQAEKDAAREESRQRKERRQALAGTLAELRSSNKKRSGASTQTKVSGITSGAEKEYPPEHD